MLVGVPLKDPENGPPKKYPMTTLGNLGRFLFIDPLDGLGMCPTIANLHTVQFVTSAGGISEDDLNIACALHVLHMGCSQKAIDYIMAPNI